MLSPPIWTGPFEAGHAVFQELERIEELSGIRLWLRADGTNGAAPVLVEIRSGQEGMSLHSAEPMVGVDGGPQVLVIEPRIETAELGESGTVYVVVSGPAVGQPVFVGMIADSYAAGRSRIGGEARWTADESS